MRTPCSGRVPLALLRSLDFRLKELPDISLCDDLALLCERAQELDEVVPIARPR